MSMDRASKLTLRLLAILFFSAASYTAKAQYSEEPIQDSVFVKERNNSIHVTGLYFPDSFHSGRIQYQRKLFQIKWWIFSDHHLKASAGRYVGYLMDPIDLNYVTLGIASFARPTKKFSPEAGISGVYFAGNDGFLVLPTLGVRYQSKSGFVFRFGLIDAYLPGYYSIGYSF